jgi:hypothetical protein
MNALTTRKLNAENRSTDPKVTILEAESLYHAQRQELNDGSVT